MRGCQGRIAQSQPPGMYTKFNEAGDGSISRQLPTGRFQCVASWQLPTGRCCLADLRIWTTESAEWTVPRNYTGSALCLHAFLKIDGLCETGREFSCCPYDHSSGMGVSCSDNIVLGTSRQDGRSLTQLSQQENSLFVGRPVVSLSEQNINSYRWFPSISLAVAVSLSSSSIALVADLERLDTLRRELRQLRANHSRRSRRDTRPCLRMNCTTHREFTQPSPWPCPPAACRA